MLYLKFRKSHFTFKETDELLLEICKNMINDETSKPNKTASNIKPNKTGFNNKTYSKFNKTIMQNQIIYCDELRK